MKLIRLREQISEETPLEQEKGDFLPFMEDGEDLSWSVKRGKEEKHLCMKLSRRGDEIRAKGSYYVGVDWVKEGECAVQVYPKMNDGFEIDYVKMLNEALCEPENVKHLDDLITIRFDKPSIALEQQQDLLSIFLIVEYLKVLHRIVRKGLKKSFYLVEENLENKVKGRILIGQTINKNHMRGKKASSVCSYQVYDVDSLENRVLKKALCFCHKQLEVYKRAIDISELEHVVRYIRPYFEMVDDDVTVGAIQTLRVNPIYKEYRQAIEFARLILRRFSYDITLAGKKNVDTPPFWIDMSKLFELYVFRQLKTVFSGKEEVQYHVKIHYQELDYLLKPQFWPEPYVIDAKYKPRYDVNGISMDDAREVSGYARLQRIYEELGLDAAKNPPIKCLIIYPNQACEECFSFTRDKEADFDTVSGYVRFYKVGIRLPEISECVSHSL